MDLTFFKLTVKIDNNRVVKIERTPHPMIHWPTYDPKISNISKFGGRICCIFEIHYESSAFAMLSFMNFNEFGDSIRKTKCQSGRATFFSISQTAKILFKTCKIKFLL